MTGPAAGRHCGRGRRARRGRERRRPARLEAPSAAPVVREPGRRRACQGR